MEIPLFINKSSFLKKSTKLKYRYVCGDDQVLGKKKTFKRKLVCYSISVFQEVIQNYKISYPKLQLPSKN